MGCSVRCRRPMVSLAFLGRGSFCLDEVARRYKGRGVCLEEETQTHICVFSLSQPSSVTSSLSTLRPSTSLVMDSFTALTLASPIASEQPEFPREEEKQGGTTGLACTIA
ncbi:hypothetical protein BC835DRAFT_1323049 [Cytidiella melzeri]|nr:hypothetical protein BC835DRAFT_1323049 [Cytidiella melzeri]